MRTSRRKVLWMPHPISFCGNTFSPSWVLSAGGNGLTGLSLDQQIGAAFAQLEEAALLVERVIAVGGQFGRPIQVNCSVAPFIPKPGTPFQWEPMRERAYLEEARRLLNARLRGAPVKIAFHNIDRSIVEAALARGGREVGRVLERAADAGCFLDAWDEAFDFARWRTAFSAAGIDLEAYACRRLLPEEPLAWGHIYGGVSTGFLERERRLALAHP